MTTTAASDATDVLAIGPEVTVAHAAELRERLLAAIADGRTSLGLDLSDVTDFDSAGVQLLLAARRTLSERGGALTIDRASSTVRGALEVFGLAVPLGLATA